MAVFGNKTKTGEIVANFAAVSVPGIETGWAVEAIQRDRELVVHPRVTKEPEVAIPYDRLLAYTLGTEQEIVERRKSLYGRAAVGGILLGPAGAVVGAIDGTTKKRKKVRRTYLSMECGDEGDPRAVVLEVVGATLGLSKFLAELAARAPWAAPGAPDRPARIEL